MLTTTVLTMSLLAIPPLKMLMGIILREIATLFLVIPVFLQLKITVLVSPKSMEQMALLLSVLEPKLPVLAT